MSREDRSTAVSGLRLSVRGSVQGVGFRPWLARCARSLGLRGTARNVAGGVTAEVFGSSEALASFRALLEAPPLAGAGVEAVEYAAVAAPAPRGFEILESEPAVHGGVAGLGLAPDLPICAACLDELGDPGSRRHRYPFIACAGCGPRYTMARSLPYDRARTAMADFPLCPACSAEYRQPDDRRFHAEATACPTCGPSLRCLSRDGELISRGEAALGHAVATLRRGAIVAIQGVGGFHLACDARDDAAVARLRERKRRPGRPLAVMTEAPADAAKLVELGAEGLVLLASLARPIVLLRRREGSGLAPSIAPGSPMVGVMLAYTPLHVLLLRDFGGPLVMTSANRSGEPIAYRLAEAASTLSDLADVVLAHDREIVGACDDSVALPAPGAPILLRRSRGHVPRPILLARPLRHSVLALGGQWSNTICVARGDRAWLGPHLGDLDSPESVARLAETVERWLGLTGIEPEIVAHDLHPGYESTRFAARWATEAPGTGAPCVGVQHHHAHLAAVLGEHGVSGPALGLAWDGTGDGGDGSAWGGELLFGDAGSCERLATFRPIRLAGGERAIRAPWRLALALLDDAFAGRPPLDRLALFDHVDPDGRERVRALLAAPGLGPAAHGVGRYFDAVGSLLLVRPDVTYQGELAQGLNFLCTAREAPPYGFALEVDHRPWEIDLRPAIRELVRDLLDRVERSVIAERFHATLVAAGEAAVRAGLRATGSEVPLVLAGGCFQNPLLVAGFERHLGSEVRLLRPVQLPPGDGGLAFGQALVAAAGGESTRPATTRRTIDATVPATKEG